MNEKLNDFQTNMCIRNFSQRTVKLYTSKLLKYLNYCSENSRDVNSASFKDFIYLLKTRGKLSTATLKQSIGAVKFFFVIP